MRRVQLPICMAVWLTFMLCPPPVEAHLNSTGMGPLYDGLVHFVLSPEDIIPALALALLVGLRGAAYGRRTLLVLPLAWFLGGLCGTGAAVSVANSYVTAAWFLLIGGLLAADARLSLRVLTGLAILLGLSHGYLNGTGMAGWGDSAVALIGLAFAVFVLVALAASLVVGMRAPWTRIAVRVAGSWVAGSGLLLLGWAVRTR